MYSTCHYQNQYETIVNESNVSIVEDQDDYGHGKKRRVLSYSQRLEANKRERHRMEIINHAFDKLRNVLPYKRGRKRQKLSRMDTVDGAIQYIQMLLEILHRSTYNQEFA